MVLYFRTVYNTWGTKCSNGKGVFFNESRRKFAEKYQINKIYLG